MPRLVIYVRTLISVECEAPGELSIKFLSPSGQLISDSPVGPDFLTEKLAEAREQGAPHATIISQFTMQPFPLLENGRFVVVSEFGNENLIAGFLNIVNNANVAR